MPLRIPRRRQESVEEISMMRKKMKRLPPVVLKGYLADNRKCEPESQEVNNEIVKCVQCDRTFDHLLDLYQHCQEEHPDADGHGDRPSEENDKEKGKSVEHEEGDHGVSVSKATPASESATTPASSQQKIRTTWCEICKKHLATVSSRNLHMRIHTGERPFSCPYCDKTFTQSVHLRSHVSVHTGAKPYVCEICGKGFVASRTLKIHLMSHNNRDGPHCCRWCSRKFPLRSHLMMHMQTYHPLQPVSKSTTLPAQPVANPVKSILSTVLKSVPRSKHRLPPRVVPFNTSNGEGRKEKSMDQLFVDDQEKDEDVIEEDDEQDQALINADDTHFEWQTSSAITVKQESPEDGVGSGHRSVNYLYDTSGPTPSSTTSRNGGTRSSNWRNSNGNEERGRSANMASSVAENERQCPTCAIVGSELQLLKNELGVIKQFLGNKLTLMEQKIDNFSLLIK